MSKLLAAMVLGGMISALTIGIAVPLWAHWFDVVVSYWAGGA